LLFWGFSEREEAPFMRKRKRYMTIKEAATFLDIAPNTLRNWGASGKIDEKRHPISNYRIYEKSELARLAKTLECTMGRPKKPR